jgi:hypothetical protein
MGGQFDGRFDEFARAAASHRSRREVLKLGAGALVAGVAATLPFGSRASATTTPRDRCIDYCDRFDEPAEHECTKGCRQCAGAEPCTPCGDTEGGCFCQPTTGGFSTCVESFSVGVVGEECTSNAECRAEYGSSFVCTTSGFCAPICGTVLSPGVTPQRFFCQG